MSTNRVQAIASGREARRFQAWDLNKKGRQLDEIAEILGVTQQTVKQWLSRVEEGGVEALRTRKGQGRKPLLNTTQCQQLLKLLEQGAAKYGFVNDVWTSKRVSLVIQREFDVVYAAEYIRPLLSKLGWKLSSPEQDLVRRKMRSLQYWHPDIWDELDEAVLVQNKP